MSNPDLTPAQWRNSTYSGDGGHCVECAVTSRASGMSSAESEH
ncbi:DUF397 domain-containing protein [Actinoallomurus acanthiterrae]